MFIITTSTSKFLLFIWFVVVGFALVSIAYYLFSSELRRRAATEAGPQATEAARLKRQAAQLIEYIGAGLIVAVLLLLSINWILLYRYNKERIAASQTLALFYQYEQYHEKPVGPNLLFAASSETTVAGILATIDSSFILTAKLEDSRMKFKRCDGKRLHNLAKTANAHFETVDLTLSKNAAIDDADNCYVSWSWVAVPQHPGIAIALAVVTLPGPHGPVHFTKSVHVAVRPKEETSTRASSVSAIVVALLSLAGVIATAVLNGKKPASK